MSAYWHRMMKNSGQTAASRWQTRASGSDDVKCRVLVLPEYSLELLVSCRDDGDSVCLLFDKPRFFCVHVKDFGVKLHKSPRLGYTVNRQECA